MSRIHDALKKAQEEQAERREDGAAEIGLADAPEGIPGGLEPAALEAAEEPSRPLTLAELEQRCPAVPWKLKARSLLFTDPSERSVASEEFRTLRSRLYQIRERQPLRTLLVASSLPGEGKTFVATNLAQAIVQQEGRSVLLLDADLRLARAHQLLGAPASPGLSEYLRGDVDGWSILQRGPKKGLFFIAGGKPYSNPVELIANGKLKGLLQRLAPVFDWIILDSPPAVPLSDASLLAELCDGVVLVVQSGSTPFDLAQKARAEFRDRHVVGVVLNRVPPRAAYSAYYYGVPPAEVPPKKGETNPREGRA